MELKGCIANIFTATNYYTARVLTQATLLFEKLQNMLKNGEEIAQFIILCFLLITLIKFALFEIYLSAFSVTNNFKMIPVACNHHMFYFSCGIF